MVSREAAAIDNEPSRTFKVVLNVCEHLTRSIALLQALPRPEIRESAVRKIVPHQRDRLRGEVKRPVSRQHLPVRGDDEVELDLGKVVRTSSVGYLC